MDTLTHALSGALLARATAPGRSDEATFPLRRRLLVGFLAAAAPDLDFVIGFVGPIEYLYHHRGVTYSLVMLPLWAFLMAHLFSLIWRRDRSWRAYFGVAALGLAIHIAGDWITSFGTMVFSPFSDACLGIGATFIIDLWFSGIILAGLAASWLWRASPVPAIAGLAALCGYIAFQGTLHQRAIEWGGAHARASGLRQAEVTAQPRPVSPFNWMVVVRNGEDVRYSFVNLVRREPRRLAPGAGFIARLDAAYLPLAQAQWVHGTRFGASETERILAREAWSQPQFAFYRWFAEEPVLLRVEAGNPSTCAWFQDLRFFTPGRDAWPFRYGMCREGGGPWQLFRLDAQDVRTPIR
ncbi:MAG: metal-dependent hydrolase [Betaproteobacteria bacterium]|nr:metal-dependent hydrolase [Betaproteobacteria bacterium]